MPANPNETLAWRLLSYLSADAETQIALIGPSGEWFCREKSRNRGANYLLGVAISFLNHAFLLEKSQGENFELMEFTAFLAPLTCSRAPDIWSIEALKTSEEWKTIRIYASAVLAIAQMPFKLPKQPFSIELIMDELHGYRH